ncbi:MAG: hypothetical protein GX316_05050, partial [Firmicutes bacterium]|nr:hypothetical protein [Bacillota bacterium]
MSALRASEDPAAIFVDHPSVSVLRNPVNLKLLQSYALEAQRQLVLVTNDSLLQSLADEYGILWYHDEKQLRETLTDAAVGV